MGLSPLRILLLALPFVSAAVLQPAPTPAATAPSAAVALQPPPAIETANPMAVDRAQLPVIANQPGCKALVFPHYNFNGFDRTSTLYHTTIVHTIMRDCNGCVIATRGLGPGPARPPIVTSKWAEVTTKTTHMCRPTAAA